jgi:hypothetical protein
LASSVLRLAGASYAGIPEESFVAIDNLCMQKTTLAMTSSGAFEGLVEQSIGKCSAARIPGPAS